MRRAQSVRHYARPSLALGADDLGMLREGDESNEDVLRRQLLDKDRENDKVGHYTIFMTHIQIQVGLAVARPDTEPPISTSATTAARNGARTAERV
jgi:hypothetical protein